MGRLDASWLVLGLLGGIFGTSWEHPGPSLGHLEAILGYLGTSLRPHWAIIRQSWGQYGLWKDMKGFEKQGMAEMGEVSKTYTALEREHHV